MKILLFVLLFSFSSCIFQDSEITVCPCEVVAVKKIQDGYKLTLHGTSKKNYANLPEFDFLTAQYHSIGDIIK